MNRKTRSISAVLLFSAAALVLFSVIFMQFPVFAKGLPENGGFARTYESGAAPAADSIAAKAAEDYTNPPAITEFASRLLYCADNSANIIPFGGFESTERQLWEKEPLSGCGFVSISGRARTGSSSLKISSGKKINESEIIWADTAPDTDYVLSVSLLGEFLGGGNYGEFSMSLINGKTLSSLGYGSSATAAVTPPNWDNRWHRRAVEFNSGDADKIGILITAGRVCCYIDDLIICKKDAASYSPSAADISADPALKRGEPATVIISGGGEAKCDAADNLFLQSGKLSVCGDSTDNFDGCKKLFSMPEIHNTSNTVIKYNSVRANKYNIVKMFRTEPYTRYAVSVKLRAERQGNAAFTVLTPEKRLLKISPAGISGKWESYVAVIDTKSDTELGIGIFDGGGELTADDIVICRYTDADIKEIVNNTEKLSVFVEASELYCPPGDVNCDENINAEDLAMLKIYLLNGETPADLYTANVNRDIMYDINIIDLVALKKLLSK